MRFNADVLSLEWLGWAVLVAVAYWLLPPRTRLIWLSLACLTFLIGVAPASAVVVLAFGVVAWTAGHSMTRRTLATAAGCSVILLSLAWTKVAAQTGHGGIVHQLAVPLGMSYYSFRCIHYVLERYKGTLPPHTAGEFATYLLFLPTFTAGPIHRFPEFHRDLGTLRPDPRELSQGLERILYGNAKVVLLANYLVNVRLSAVADAVHASSEWGEAYLRMLVQGLNAYLQFAGYSDIAIGVALLMGFKVMENFRAPFFACSIQDFWRRWHISLTSWCRDYVYTTIVSIFRRPAFAALVTMLAIGLWHEISLRYVLWGAWHGAGLIAWQAFQHVKHRVGYQPSRVTHLIGCLCGFVLTFNFVMLSFVLLRDGGLDEAIATYRLLLTGSR